jgi:hypothetical protein
MFARWRPIGTAGRVVRVDDSNDGTALERTLNAIAEVG